MNAINNEVSNRIARVARFIQSHDCDLVVLEVTQTSVICADWYTDTDGSAGYDIRHITTIREAKHWLGY